MNNNSREKSIYRITLIGTIVNVILTVAKFLAGFFGHSGAMIADAVHSCSDFFTDIVVLLFVHISAKPNDKSHDFGHGKFETLATVIIGIALLAVAIGIITHNAQLIVQVINGQTIAAPSIIALYTAAISIIAKELLYQATVKVGKNTNSPAVIANAWHHRSDAFSSVGTLIGIAGAFFLGEKWRILDPIAAIVVGLFIIKVAIELIIPGLNELLEKSLPDEEETKILKIITENPSIKDPHNLKTRKIGANIAIDLHIRLDENMSVKESHAITVDIENKIRQEYGPATQITLHVEPYKKP
ncbi:MAG: cation transporter [Bacteroidetes bacterium]|uniref:Cation transporter n=1 Tax=Candidatus Gallipaludibacter merdavium TaxID=2840839 RepID=A0A9D9N4C1_9BACT|nr:cation transporter [Candidatus Gallipaludibacter merdavium]